MASLSKLQASLIRPTQETTVALANLNFDFSLLKIEPREEYRQIGSVLAPLRKSAGETGTHHVTARRLGVLFRSILPTTPHLIRAYGERASQISRSPEANPQGTSDHGPFQQYVGIDGSSLWAAATSGDEAIAVHLLACMLASHWPADEATAIWVELVEERKQELGGATGDRSFSIEDAVASQLAVTRQQLEEWDASARAWLVSAKHAPEVKERQMRFMDTLKEVRLPVQGPSDVCRSVTDAWKLALTTVDKIVSGAGFSVQDGAVLLALSSWHLYPDLLILTGQPRKIVQGDPLVQPGGVVTLGLSLPRDDERYQNRLGVSWSLSLSHLRYHGSRVTVSRQTDHDEGRFTIGDFMLVLLGSIIGCWNLGEPVTIENAMELISLVISRLEDAINIVSTGYDMTSIREQSWITPIKSAISRYRSHKDGVSDAERLSQKLMKLGTRHPSIFEDKNLHITGTNFSVHCGLNSLEIVNFLTKEEKQIEFLRNLVASRVAPALDAKEAPFLLIRCRAGIEVSLYTAIPYLTPGAGNKPKHYRWVSGSAQMSCDDEVVSNIDTRDFLFTTEAIVPREGSWFDAVWRNAPEVVREVRKAKRSRVKTIIQSEPGGMVLRPWARPSVKPITGFHFYFIGGRMNGTALYLLANQQPNAEFIPVRLRPGRVEIINLLKSADLGIGNFVSFLGSSGFFRRLLVISGLWNVFRGLPDSTISPAVLALEKPLPRTPPPPQLAGRPDFEIQESQPWRDLLYDALCLRLSMPGTFSTIYRFETGSPYVTPTNLAGVFAMSSGDSLYISANLLTDPGIPARNFEIRKVRGNIGRPGVVFLIEPREALVRQPNPEAWKIINHNQFTGSLEDAFRDLSLHLMLTGYELPIDTQRRGYKFTDASIAEAVVSAHSSGAWVSDLDLKMLSARGNPRGVESPAPNQSINLIVEAAPGCIPPEAGQMPSFDLATIENWDELLDPPLGPGVFMGHGNWQARLAAVCVSQQLGYHTVVFGYHGCWECGFRCLERILVSPNPNVPAPPRSVRRVFGRNSSSSNDGDKSDASAVSSRDSSSSKNCQPSTHPNDTDVKDKRLTDENAALETSSSTPLETGNSTDLSNDTISGLNLENSTGQQPVETRGDSAEDDMNLGEDSDSSSGSSSSELPSSWVDARIQPGLQFAWNGGRPIIFIP